MANLKPVYASESTIIDTGLNSLASGSGAGSSEVDNSSNRYLDLRIDVEMAAAAANTGYVDIYLQEGSTTAKLSTTANKGNMRHIGSLQLNGTTTVRKSFFAKNASEFWGARAENTSGGALAASGNTVKYTGINYENI